MKERKVKLNITDINTDGAGVGRTENGEVVFVPLAAPGDSLEALIIKEAKSYSVGKITEIFTPSKYRIAPLCPVYEHCGGCVYGHISYDAELELKSNSLYQALSRIGGIEVERKKTLYANSSRYRNKAVYPIGEADSKTVFGYYSRHSHRIVPHSDCLLQNPRFSQIAASFCSMTSALGIPPYNENTGDGFIRHLCLRQNREGVFYALIIATHAFSDAYRLAEALMRENKDICGVSLNINGRRDNVIMGDSTMLLCGEKTLTDTLCGNSFTMSPQSFYQVNAEAAELLYKTASKLADIKRGEVVLDLYCGIGTVGICCSGLSNPLCGVEIVPEAVANATLNANNNGRKKENTLFVAGDALLGASECKRAFGNPDVVFIDPPRKGIPPELVRDISSISAKRIVYISCNPATLARDAKLFLENGYKTVSSVPVNMFPRTGHVEACALLSH